MQNNARIVYLFQKLMASEATLGEQEELRRLLVAPENKDFAEQHILEAFEKGSGDSDISLETRKAMLEVIFQSTEKAFSVSQGPIRKYRIFRRIGLTAAAILIVGTALGLYFFSTWKSENTKAGRFAVTEIAPGGNQATLTLADGTKINLDSAKAGIQINDEHIVYNDKTPLNVILSGVRENEGKGAEGSLPTSLSLSTPRGGQYQIILPDGTNVWLNAASTLKYPSRFNGNNREVFLEGEAYFEIKEDKTKPFKVLSKNQVIEVLGTSFNLAAYADEKETKTTLAEGKLQIALPGARERDGQSTIMLSPGEQSILSGARLSKQEADIGTVIAWKNGYFNFNKLSTQEALRQLARWYNVDIVYQNNIPDIKFYGKMERSLPLNTVLQILEKLNLKCRVEEGRKLVIL